MRKASIEDAIADYNAALDDAARAFQVIYALRFIYSLAYADASQIATLINIHLAVGEATPSKSRAISVSEPSTATIRDEGAEPAPPRSATLPPYVSGSTETVTDVQALSTSPGPTRSATVWRPPPFLTSFTLTLIHFQMSSYGTASRSDSGGRSERTMRSPASSFDLIDLSSPISGEFGSILSSRRGTSFGSIAEEPEQDSDTHEVREEEEPSITEHHGVSLSLGRCLRKNQKLTRGFSSTDITSRSFA